MNTDFEKLQGTWRIVSAEIEGQTMPSTIMAGSTITLKGDTFTTSSMGAVYEGKVEIDENTKPKRFDLTFTKGPEEGNVSHGIYELKGDQWKICMTLRGGKRPTTFATTAGSGLALEVLTRGDAAEKKPSAKMEKSSAAKGGGKTGATPLDGEWSLVSGIRDGLPMDTAMVNSGKRADKNGEMKVSFGPHVMLRANVTIHAESQPNGMDYDHTGGMFAGQKQLAIFELKGNLFTVCSAPPGKPRPKEFKSVPGDGRSLMVWNRKK